MKKNIFQICKASQFEKKITLEKIIILLKADLNIIDTLTIITENTKNKHIKSTLLSILRKLEKGLTLSESINDSIVIKNNTIKNLIELIDDTGDIDLILSQILDYETKKLQIIKNIKKSLTYPIILLISINIFLIIASSKIIPIFLNIYTQQGIPTPKEIYIYGKIVMVLKMLIYFGVILMIFLIGHFKFNYKYKNKINYIISKASLKCRIYKNIKIYFVFYSIYLLINAGYRIDAAIEKIGSNETNLVLKNTLENILGNLKKGMSLSESFENEKDIYGWFVDFLKISEGSGESDQSFRRISIILENDINNEITKICMMIEPILIIILGILVGVLIINLIIPLINFEIFI